MRTSCTAGTASPSWNVRRSLWRSPHPTSEERIAALRTRGGHEILEALLAAPGTLPTPVAVPAAVDGERVTVDEGALLGVREERDGPRHVVRGGGRCRGRLPQRRQPRPARLLLAGGLDAQLLAGRDAA